jgi:excisionase family DNA binding protein
MQHVNNERVSNMDALMKLGHVDQATTDPRSEAKPRDWLNERLAWRIDDFCRAIGLGRTKVYAMIKDGSLHTVVVGGRRLVPRESAEALLKQAATGNQAA